MASVIYFFCLLAVATSTPRDPGQLKSENETFRMPSTAIFDEEV